MRERCELLRQMAIERGVDHATVLGHDQRYRATVASRGDAGRIDRRQAQAELRVEKAGHVATATVDNFDTASLQRAVDDVVAGVEMSVRIHGERDGQGVPLALAGLREISVAPVDGPLAAESARTVLRRIEARDGIAFGEVIAAFRETTTFGVDDAGTRELFSSIAGLRLRAAASRDYSYYVRSGFGGPLGRWSATDCPWSELDRVEADAMLVGEEAVVLAATVVPTVGYGSVALEPALASLALLSLARRRFSPGPSGAASDLLSVASTTASRAAIDRSERFVAASDDSMVVRAGVPDPGADSSGALIWVAPTGEPPLPNTGLAVFGLAGATMRDDGSVDLVTELAWTVNNGRLDQPLRGARIRLDADWMFRIAATADTGNHNVLALPEHGTSALDARFRTIRAPAVIVDNLAWAPIDGGAT